MLHSNCHVYAAIFCNKIVWTFVNEYAVRVSVCQSVSLSVCQSVSLSVCQSVSLSVSLSVCQSVSLSVCQSVSLSVSLPVTQQYEGTPSQKHLYPVFVFNVVSDSQSIKQLCNQTCMIWCEPIHLVSSPPDGVGVPSTLHSLSFILLLFLHSL